MDIIRLDIENFLTIGKTSLSLTDKGLVLINGVNLEESSASSNGAGKSSIPDALFWALYGDTAREESGDDVVNTTAKKNCSVRVILRDGEIGYVITRHRKHSVHKNATIVTSFKFDDVDKLIKGELVDTVDMAKGTEKETQLVINEIVGCTKEVFAASIYSGQEQMPDLPRMTDKQLKVLLEEAAGTERLERVYARAQGKVLDAKNELARVGTDVERLQSSVLDSNERLRVNATRYKDYDTGRKDKAAAIESQVTLHQNELKAQEEKLVALDEPGLLKAATAVKEKLDGVKPMQEKYASLVSVVSKQEVEVVRLSERLSASKTALARLITGYKNAETEMLKPCHACGKPHTPDEIDDWKKHQKSLIDEKGAEAKEIESSLAVANENLAAAKKAAEDFKATIPDTADFVALQRKVSEKMAEIRTVRQAIKTSMEKIENLQKQIHETLHGKNPYHDVITDEKKANDELRAKLAKRKSEIFDYERKLQVAEAVAKVYSPAGVRALILDTVTPFLNDKTSEYLAALSDGSISAVWSTLAPTVKGELREKFNIDVTNATGAKTFKGLSGGEKRKVRLATMLALQDLVATRATKPINLWIGDEIDDALDPAGLERLMSIVERKARERGTVLVISHNELTDWIDQVTTVIKEGGFSHVEGALVTS